MVCEAYSKIAVLYYYFAKGLTFYSGFNGKSLSKSKGPSGPKGMSSSTLRGAELTVDLKTIKPITRRHPLENAKKSHR